MSTEFPAISLPPPLTPVAGRSRWRRIGAILILLAIPFMLVYVYRTQPGHDSLLPKCTFHQLTGLNCVGCGGTRSMHSLLHGQIKQAFWYNPFAVIAGPYMVYALARWSIAQWRGQPPTHYATLWPPKWVWTGVVALMLFWVVRNLPWYPLGP